MMREQANLVALAVWLLLCVVSACSGEPHRDTTDASATNDSHPHSEQYHRVQPNRVSVDFGGPIGHVSSWTVLELREATSPDQNWIPTSKWHWVFRSSDKSKYERERKLKITLPAGSSYDELDRRYSFRANTSATEPNIVYKEGRDSDTTTYALRASQEDPGFAEVKSIKGTTVTVELSVELRNIHRPSDSVKVQKQFSSVWDVECSYNFEGEKKTWKYDSLKQSEFCSQFRQAPWPHHHQ